MSRSLRLRDKGAHLDDGRQDALRVVRAERAVDLRQLCRHGPRQHPQPNVHLQASHEISCRAQVSAFLMCMSCKNKCV